MGSRKWGVGGGSCVGGGGGGGGGDSYRGAPLTPAWAALSTTGLKALPIIPGVRRLILLSDNDTNQEGQLAAAAAALRWQAAGLEVVTLTPPTPDSDFNDLVIEEDARVADPV